MIRRDKEKLAHAEYEYETNIYEDFMKKHLSHYGYYTGRNEMYRAHANFTEWNNTYGYVLSESSDSCEEGTSSRDYIYEADKSRTTQLLLNLESGKLISRLKAPRHLYADSGGLLGPQQQSRWPSELEVIDELINHVQQVPFVREPFYIQHGLEVTPDIKGTENGGQIVFELKSKPGLFFHHSRVGGSVRDGDGLSEAAISLSGPEDTTLIFESRFESGNLEKAIKVGPYEYELWMRNDLYTNKHTQWFYFRVSNTRKDVPYRFTICNFTKSSSLYNEGMRPVAYSNMESDKSFSKLAGWHRTGSNIRYYKTGVRYIATKTERSYYALNFTTQFVNDNDAVYFAHCYPYTYADLQAYLNGIVNDPEKIKLCKLRILCRTLAGNLVYWLTITSPGDEDDISKQKKAVVVTARVHPGETNSSWMMKGVMDYLTSNSPSAKLLRDTFIFKVVPMLNPDGVIVGNYRCSLAGRDLNRNYGSSLKDSFPSIWHTKQMIQRTLSERDILVYCDMHGHSKKQNVFIYGCENRTDSRKRLHERVFPAMLGQKAHDYFSYDECNFKVQKSKEGTGRITVWNMGIANSYTMEATFCGGTFGKFKNCHFTTADFESIGRHFCDTLLEYCNQDKFRQCLADIEASLKADLIARLVRRLGGRGEVTVHGKAVNLNMPEEVDISDVYSLCLDDCSNDGNYDDDGGSNSSASDGLPVKVEYMQKLKSLKKKKKRKRKDRDKRRPKVSQDTARVSESRHSTVSLSSTARSAAAEVSSSKNLRSRHEKCQGHDHQSKCEVPAPAAQKSGDGRNELGPRSSARTKSVEDACGVAAGAPAFKVGHPNAVLRAKQTDTSVRTMTNTYLTRGMLVTQQSALSNTPLQPHFKYSTGSHGSHFLAQSMDNLCSDSGDTSATSRRHKLSCAGKEDFDSRYRRHEEATSDVFSSNLHRYESFSALGANDIEKTLRSRISATAFTAGDDSYHGFKSSYVAFDEQTQMLDAPYRGQGKPIKQHPLPFDHSLDVSRVAGSMRDVRAPYRHLEEGPAARRDARVITADMSRMGKKPSAFSGISAEFHEGRRPKEQPLTGALVSGRDGISANSKYLDRMVKETDAAIRYLANRIEGMNRQELQNTFTRSDGGRWLAATAPSGDATRLIQGSESRPTVPKGKRTSS